MCGEVAVLAVDEVDAAEVPRLLLLEVELVVWYEALYAPHTRQRFGLAAEGRGELGEFDGAYRDKCIHLQRKKLYERLVDCFSEVGLQDVE